MDQPLVCSICLLGVEVSHERALILHTSVPGDGLHVGTATSLANSSLRFLSFLLVVVLQRRTLSKFDSFRLLLTHFFPLDFDRPSDSFVLILPAALQTVQALIIATILDALKHPRKALVTLPLLLLLRLSSVCVVWIFFLLACRFQLSFALS